LFFPANLAPYSAAFGICVMQAPAQTRNTEPHVYNVGGDVEGTHDPSIAKEGSTWYLFGTVTEKAPDGQLPIRCSRDLQYWKLRVHI
jgi:arabinan endo-1,5-alpha-L-arabinosidase